MSFRRQTEFRRLQTIHNNEFTEFTEAAKVHSNDIYQRMGRQHNLDAWRNKQLDDSYFDYDEN